MLFWSSSCTITLSSATKWNRLGCSFLRFQAPSGRLQISLPLYFIIDCIKQKNNITDNNSSKIRAAVYPCHHFLVDAAKNPSTASACWSPRSSVKPEQTNTRRAFFLPKAFWGRKAERQPCPTAICRCTSYPFQNCLFVSSIYIRLTADFAKKPLRIRTSCAKMQMQTLERGPLLKVRRIWWYTAPMGPSPALGIRPAATRQSLSTGCSRRFGKNDLRIINSVKRPRDWTQGRFHIMYYYKHWESIFIYCAVWND